MVKIRKKTSKRVGLREKYAVQKKVRAHHKKMRKAARKMGEAGIRPKPAKTKMVIPNSFPGKEELINHMERQQEMERQRQKDKIDNMKQADKTFKNENDINFDQVMTAPIVK